MANKSEKKKTVKVIKPLRQSEMSETISTNNVNKSPFPFVTKLLLVAILGTLLYFLALKYRGLFLAGTVNSTPITRYELNSKLVSQYGQKALDELVNEKLLAAEIKKNQITVTDEEVKTEVDKLVMQYGGEESYKAALEQFNLTEEKAKDSIKQSLSFKKLVEKTTKIEISDEAVKKNFEDNKKAYDGKKFEEVSASIKDSLYQQELFTKSQEMFTKIRQEAKINTYIQ